MELLITKGKLSPDSLKGEVAVVTGAGRGIGFEAAKALMWLGANVVIAEVDEKNGKNAAEELNQEFGAGRAHFVKTDIGDDKNVENLAREAKKKFGKVDIILNNATVVSGVVGAVKDVPIAGWDLSYRVNLRGPVLLARAFLPEMINRKHGVFVCVSSSGAAPYIGAYEVFKTAQVELANTVTAELEGTGVYAFTIGPGIVRTPGFVEGGGKLASHMGITLEQLLEINKRHEISPEAAGTGFAAAIALASQYNGQETSSIQVLRAIGINLASEEEKEFVSETTGGKEAGELGQAVLKTYVEQSESWKKRNIFERQWMRRDFKKSTGMSIDGMLVTLKNLEASLKSQVTTAAFIEPLNRLAAYYEHQQELLKGFEKDPKKLQENLAIMDGWIRDIRLLIKTLAD